MRGVRMHFENFTYFESFASVFLVIAVFLGIVGSFIPYRRVLKINPDSIPPHIPKSMPLNFLTVPFWTLNKFGKTIRVAMYGSFILAFILIYCSIFFD